MSGVSSTGARGSLELLQTVEAGARYLGQGLRHAAQAGDGRGSGVVESE